MTRNPRRIDLGLKAPVPKAKALKSRKIIPLGEGVGGVVLVAKILWK